MDNKHLDQGFDVADQLVAEDIPRLAEAGYRRLLCVRPDDEEGDYLSSEAAEALARRHGLEWVHAPFRGSEPSEAAVAAVAEALTRPESPTLAYCRTGRRVALAWALARRRAGEPVDVVTARVEQAGFELGEFRERLAATERSARSDAGAAPSRRFDLVIVGGGSAGLATLASLRVRGCRLDVAIVEPSEVHHYQPGLTLAGTGHFDPADLTRPEASLIPDDVTWIRTAASGFDPDAHRVLLVDGSTVEYRALIVAPGLTLDWDGIDGARESLGQYGVCSNYSPEYAPYTWDQIQALERGRALFTQPPMPIKCAGAPQKAMYLACDRWRKAGRLGEIDVHFHNAGGVLFGVEHFVPVLMEYVKRYGAELHFGSRLVAIDGPGRSATFSVTDDAGTRDETVGFDFLHFVPPQKAPDCVAGSPLADAAGWLDVDPETLQHVRYPDVFGAGDVLGTGNAKTMAAARKHAPIVAENLLAHLDGRELPMGYDGYGACPLTVEAGRVVLAEFGYNGKLLPTFPLEPAKPRWSQWILKRHLMPIIYWQLMLEGREWFCAPTPRSLAEEGEKTAAGR